MIVDHEAVFFIYKVKYFQFITAILARELMEIEIV